MVRKKVPDTTQSEVLTRSRRRCCICYGLYGDLEIKKGQIAHLDKDNSNPDLENLAFLCLEHHDHYDSQTSQSKNYTIDEIKHYRQELYKDVIPSLKKIVPSNIETNEPSSPLDIKRKEIKQIIIEILEDNHGVIYGVGSLSAKLGLTSKVTEQYLYELNGENILRIDRERAKNRKSYSLISSIENRMIDAFLGSIDNDLGKVAFCLKMR